MDNGDRLASIIMIMHNHFLGQTCFSTLFSGVAKMLAFQLKNYLQPRHNSIGINQWRAHFLVYRGSTTPERCDRNCWCTIHTGGRVGLVVRALALHQCGPRSISALPSHVDQVC